MARAVQFGAGNIGRGLVGYVLRRYGYDVTFVDVVDEVVAQLNALGRYPVRILARDGERVETVDGVRALHAADVVAVTSALTDAQLVTTAVGPGVLPAVAEPIREGLRRHPATAVNVVACENMTGNSTRLRALVEGQAGWTVPAWAGFPDCVVDRIVTALRGGHALHSASWGPLTASAVPPAPRSMRGCRRATWRRPSPPSCSIARRMIRLPCSSRMMSNGKDGALSSCAPRNCLPIIRCWISSRRLSGIGRVPGLLERRRRDAEADPPGTD